MTRMVASLFALLFSIVLLNGGNAFLMTLLGVRLSIEGVAPDTIGTVLVCYSIGFVLGTLFVQKVVSRVGHIRAFAVFATIAAVASLLYPMAVDMVFWAILRAVSGFSMAGVLVVIESWFSSRATNANRSTLFAVYQVVYLLAAVGGQLLINVGNPADYVPYSLAAILLVLALVPLAMTRMEAPEIAPSPRLSVFTLARESFTGVAGAVMAGILIGSFYALGPVYATLVGLDVSQTANFMASAILAAMLLAWPIGILCDRFDRRRIMFWISVLAAIAALVVSMLGSHQLLALTLAVAVFTGLSASIYPVAVAITNDRMESSRIVAASATLLLSYGIGSVIGPVVLSKLIQLLGPQGLFYGYAAALTVLAAATSYRITHTEDIRVEDQEHFVPAMPETSMVLAEMDPRNAEFTDSPEVVVDAANGEPDESSIAKDSLQNAPAR
ncbi:MULTISPECIES: MFS transporter [unclassified Marinobacter]|uniref:MFS transporter n=1 Tax=unclassified Marinobacter TaxID=83889 RepID=UPI000BF561D1|nr:MULTISPECIES: MFS transporter [unclassified Marinobacter]PFG10488.1 nitrate/nitrite transporter NarK [Marinobacter sp. LV10MA510-1]PFG52410.1 nitrate/nitrite transporter NarK [Marinobacter sp. LV10R520-4]